MSHNLELSVLHSDLSSPKKLEDGGNCGKGTGVHGNGGSAEYISGGGEGENDGVIERIPLIQVLKNEMNSVDVVEDENDAVGGEVVSGENKNNIEDELCQPFTQPDKGDGEISNGLVANGIGSDCVDVDNGDEGDKGGDVVNGVDDNVAEKKKKKRHMTKRRKKEEKEKKEIEEENARERKRSEGREDVEEKDVEKEEGENEGEKKEICHDDDDDENSDASSSSSSSSKCTCKLCCDGNCVGCKDCSYCGSSSSSSDGSESDSGSSSSSSSSCSKSTGSCTSVSSANSSSDGCCDRDSCSCHSKDGKKKKKRKAKKKSKKDKDGEEKTSCVHSLVFCTRINESDDESEDENLIPGKQHPVVDANANGDKNKLSDDDRLNKSTEFPPYRRFHDWCRRHQKHKKNRRNRRRGGSHDNDSDEEKMADRFLLRWLCCSPNIDGAKSSMPCPSLSPDKDVKDVSRDKNGEGVDEVGDDKQSGKVGGDDVGGGDSGGGGGGGGPGSGVDGGDFNNLKNTVEGYDPKDEIVRLTD